MFFCKNHAEYVVGKLFPDSYLKSQNWTYFSINSLIQSNCLIKSFIQYIFIVYQVAGSRNVLKLSWKPLAFTSYKGVF